MTEKTRYTDDELQEFKEIILKKLEKAQSDYDLLRSNIIMMGMTHQIRLQHSKYWKKGHLPLEKKRPDVWHKGS